MEDDGNVNESHPERGICDHSVAHCIFEIAGTKQFFAGVDTQRRTSLAEHGSIPGLATVSARTATQQRGAQN